MDDISKALAFEVKKEIADRYFGFRKQIENDTSAYLELITQTALELEKNVGFDLVRIYTLLQNDSLIDTFFELTGFQSKFFFDSYVNTSATIRKRVFATIKIRGITSRSRYRNLFYDTYQQLYSHIRLFHETLQELTEEHEIISEQIKLFYRKNDIGMIMQFFRNIDNMPVGSVDLSAHKEEPSGQQDLGKKLQIIPPLPAKDLLPDIPKIPRLHTIKSDLKALIKQAFSLNVDFDPKRL